VGIFKLTFLFAIVSVSMAKSSCGGCPGSLPQKAGNANPNVKEMAGSVQERDVEKCRACGESCRRQHCGGAVPTSARDGKPVLSCSCEVRPCFDNCIKIWGERECNQADYGDTRLMSLSPLCPR